MRQEKQESWILLLSSAVAMFASYQIEKKKAKAIRTLFYMVAGLYFLAVIIIVLLLTMRFAHGA